MRNSREEAEGEERTEADIGATEILKTIQTIVVIFEQKDIQTNESALKFTFEKKSKTSKIRDTENQTGFWARKRARRKVTNGPVTLRRARFRA